LATVAVCEFSADGLAGFEGGLGVEGRPNGFATVATGVEGTVVGGGVTVADNTLDVTFGDPAKLGAGSGEGFESEPVPADAASTAEGFVLEGAGISDPTTLAPPLLLFGFAEPSPIFVAGAILTVIEDVGFATGGAPGAGVLPTTSGAVFP
jgi:hypothetical protein